MSIVSSLIRCSFLIGKCNNAKLCLLSRAAMSRSLCVVNLNCSSELASQQVKDVFKYTNNCSHINYDKWPGDCKLKVSRAFQLMKYVRRLKATVRVGTPYPEQNPQLADLIEEMKNNDINIPVEQVIERTLNPKVRSGFFEVAAPCGVLFVLHYDTSDISLTEHFVKEVCRNYEFTCLGHHTQRLVFYHQKGILTTPQNDVPLERAGEIATKAGAESVSSKVDVAGKMFLEIYCNPSELHEVKRQLEKALIIEETFVGYVPKSVARVPDTLKSKMADAIVDFSKTCEIQMIYENVK